MKKYVLSAITGMGFGFPITLLCMTMLGGYNGVIRELAVWMAASALYGVLSVAMDSRKFELPLLVSVGLHFFCCVAISMAAAMLCGYISGIGDVLPILIPSVVIYAAVCFVCFLLMKKDEKQINKALNEK